MAQDEQGFFFLLRRYWMDEWNTLVEYKMDLQQYSIKSEKTSFTPIEHSFFFDEWKKKEKKRPAFLSGTSARGISAPSGWSPFLMLQSGLLPYGKLGRGRAGTATKPLLGHSSRLTSVNETGVSNLPDSILLAYGSIAVCPRRIQTTDDVCPLFRLDLGVKHALRTFVEHNQSGTVCKCTVSTHRKNG